MKYIYLCMMVCICFLARRVAYKRNQEIHVTGDKAENRMNIKFIQTYYANIITIPSILKSGSIFPE